MALKENIRVEGKRDIQTKVMTTLFAEVEPDPISERTREGVDSQKRPTPPKGVRADADKRPASRRPRAHGRSPRACSRTAGAVHEQVVGNGCGPPGGPQHSALCGVFGGVVTGEIAVLPIQPRLADPHRPRSAASACRRASTGARSP